jgi:hypothetical protein
MWPTVFRISAFSFLISAVTAGQSAGDPVVLLKNSIVLGDVSLGTGRSAIQASYVSVNSTPSGVGTVQDGRALNVGDTRLTSSAKSITRISPLTLSAAGGITVGTEQPPDSALAGLRLYAQAESQMVIGFTLAESRAFTYTGHYFGRLDESLDSIPPADLGPLVDGTLYTEIDDTTAPVFYVKDTFPSLFTEHFTHYSGILDPGRYYFQVFSGDSLERPNTRISAEYSVTLSLASEPVPEPATVLLVTNGLTAMFAVTRRRRRQTEHVASRLA